MPRQIQIELKEPDICEIADRCESRGGLREVQPQALPMYRDVVDGVQEAIEKLCNDAIEQLRTGAQDELIRQCALNAQARRLSVYNTNS